VPGKKMMGYKEGGAMKGKDKDGNKVSYSFNEAERKKDAKKKKAKKKPMKMMADDGGSMTGKMDPKRKKVLDAIKANNSKPTPSMKTAPNNTMPPKPQAPAAPAGAPPAGAPPTPPMGGGMPPMGMGMPPKKPPMPGMKKGGKVKKYNKGGKVRGAGIAKQGVKKCKMR
jgi:hypothetical protein